MNECRECGDYCESIQTEVCDACYEEKQRAESDKVTLIKFGGK